jgi:hypothetical protein
MPNCILAQFIYLLSFLIGAKLSLELFKKSQKSLAMKFNQKGGLKQLLKQFGSYRPPWFRFYDHPKNLGLIIACISGNS